MTQLNNEFEKWATKHIVSKRLLEFNTMKYENGMYKSHIMQRKFEAWIAAKADIEREIAGLKAEIHNLNFALGTDGYEQMATPEQQLEYSEGVKKLEARIADMKHRKNVITELQAHINVLREALEIARDYQFDAVNQFHNDFAGYKEEKHKQYDVDLANTEQALASTPAQSLQAHDDAIKEELALLCEMFESGKGIDFAKQIRALKGK